MCTCAMPPGRSICHCSACHRTFGNLTGFDAHRSGPIEARVCLDPAALGYLLDDRGVWLSEGGLAKLAQIRASSKARRLRTAPGAV